MRTACIVYPEFRSVETAAYDDVHFLETMQFSTAAPYFSVRRRVLITRWISPQLTSFQLTSFYLNEVRRDWPQPRRRRVERAIERPGSPWLRPITAHSLRTKRGQLR